LSPRAIEFPVEGLTDGTILLRPPADADVPRIVEACRDPEVVRYTTVPANYKPEHAYEWMQRGVAGGAAGTDVTCVVVSAGDGDVLGTASLHEINRLTGRAVSGYFTAPWARGRGVASGSLRLLCRFAFEELRLDRVEVTIEPENAGSRRVAESVGFVEEGLLRSYLSIAGARRDMVMYALLPGDLDPPSGSDGATLKFVNEGLS
jgi:RimJ/RimL family protein N-acetyltransferase